MSATNREDICGFAGRTDMRVSSQLCSQDRQSVIKTMNKDMSHTQSHIVSLTEK